MKSLLKGVVIVSIAIPVSIIGLNTVGRVMEMRANKSNKPIKIIDAK